MLSTYELRARLPPGLLGIAPISFAIATLGLKQFPAVAILAGVLSAAGGMHALSVVVAAVGRHAEKGLWDGWGGRPSLRMLRTRDDAANQTQRDIWRAAVSLFTGVTLMTAEEEASSPRRADDTINAAVGQCLFLGQGGDQSDPIVNAENAQYGFERNLFGFRWAGRAISLGSIAALVAAFWGPWNVSVPSVAAGLVVDAGFLIFWVVTPSRGRVKLASERYATQLLNAVARRTTT